MRTALSELERHWLSDPPQSLARLATVDADGLPHVVPVGWTYDKVSEELVLGGREVLRTARARHVRRTGRAAVVIDGIADGPGWSPWAFQARGRARVDEPAGAIRVSCDLVTSWGLEHQVERAARHATQPATEATTQPTPPGEQVMTTPPTSHTTRPLDEQHWFAVDPNNPDSPTMAVLWGDPMSGPFGALLKVPAGFESPMHRHSNDERVVVLTGRSVHWTDSESREDAPVMAAGDFMTMSASTNHVSAATDDEDCLEFITMDGPFDFELA